MKPKFTPTHTKEGDFYLGIDLLGERPHDPGERSNGTGERLMEVYRPHKCL